MIRFIKFFQILSIIFFLPVLIFVYAYLPDQVVFSSARSGLAGTVISRETFFYGILILFVLSNILCIALGRAILQLPARETISGAPIFFNEASKGGVIAWLKSFCIVLNAFFIFGAMYIGMLNNEEEIQSTNFNFLIYIGPILILIWLLLFVFIILRRPKNEDLQS
ncbi:MAG: hypothetical protein M3512_10170 [Bacteroidota bacterium]|nr:hypothetical protein [Bacteroidota bacterium]